MSRAKGCHYRELKLKKLNDAQFVPQIIMRVDIIIILQD